MNANFKLINNLGKPILLFMAVGLILTIHYLKE
mgnify:CR=1 FL=1